MSDDHFTHKFAVNLPSGAQAALAEAGKINPYVRALTAALRQARSDEEALVSFTQAILILHGAFTGTREQLA